MAITIVVIVCVIFVSVCVCAAAAAPECPEKIKRNASDKLTEIAGRTGIWELCVSGGRNDSQRHCNYNTPLIIRIYISNENLFA